MRFRCQYPNWGKNMQCQNKNTDLLYSRKRLRSLNCARAECLIKPVSLCPQSVCSSKVNLHNINIFHPKCQLAVPHLYDHFKCEDSSENVVKISQNLQQEKEKVMSLRKTKLSHNTQHAAHNPTLDSDKLVASLVTGGFRLFTFNKKIQKNINGWYSVWLLTNKHTWGVSQFPLLFAI